MGTNIGKGQKKKRDSDTHVDLDVGVLEIKGELLNVDHNGGDMCSKQVLVSRSSGLEMLRVGVLA